MRMWMRGGPLHLAFCCTALSLVWPCLSQTRDDYKTGQTETITLQYRVSRDAYAPSKFVAVIDGGISVPLELIWDLSKPIGAAQKKDQEKQKKQFDDLIKKLEAEQINGAEFEAHGEWLEKGLRLRLISVPQPTEAGKQRIREGER